MQELREARFKSGEVASALGITLSEFSETRNLRYPDHRIPATEGTSTRDQRWNCLDAIRLAAIRELFGTTPEIRAAIFSQTIQDEDIEDAFSGRRLVLVVEESFQRVRVWAPEEYIARMFPPEGDAGWTADADAGPIRRVQMVNLTDRAQTVGGLLLRGLAEDQPEE